MIKIKNCHILNIGIYKLFVWLGKVPCKMINFDTKMINFDDVTKENIKSRNPNWLIILIDY